MSTDLNNIESRLRAVRGRIRRVQWTRGMLVAGGVFLTGLLLVMAADWFFAPLSTSVRWILFALWLAATLVAVKIGFSPVFKKLGLVSIARWLESRHPEMEERLSTALEISGKESASPDLVQALCEAATRDAGSVEANREVRAGAATVRWRWVALASFVILLAALVISPKVTGRLMVRAVAPFSATGNAGAVDFEIMPGDLEVMEGDAIEIKVRYAGQGQPSLELDLANGDSMRQAMVKEKEAWVFRLEPAREGFTYRAVAGRAESDGYTARVLPLPRLADRRVTKEFPEYTGLPELEELLGERVEALVGTGLRVRGKLNTPVVESWLELADGRKISGKVESAATGGEVICAWDLEKGQEGEAVWKSRNRLNREVELARFKYQATDDLKPVVTILNPVERELRVRPEERLKLAFEVEEDFGLARMELEAEAGRDGDFVEAIDLPPLIADGPVKRFRGTTGILVSTLQEKLKGAGEIHLRLRATDKLPEDSGGPGVGESEWIVLKVDRNAESMVRQELMAQQESAHSGLNKAIEETREAERRMHDNRGDLERAEMTDRSAKLTKETQEHLAEANKQLEELARQMEAGIHAPKADEVEAAREEVENALAAFEEIPLQDHQELRSEKFEEAVEHAREAVRRMEKVRDDIDRNRPQVEDLARLEEMAQRQAELARQAAKQANEENPAMTDEWRERQKQIENELRDQMWQRPQSLAEALQKQAEAAEEFAKEAREMAATQDELQELVKESAGARQAPKSDEERTEDLKEALSRAQKEVAAESREAQREEARAESEREQAAAADESQNGAEDQQAADEPTSEHLAEAASQGQEAARKMDQNEMAAAAESAREAADSLQAASENSDGSPEDSPEKVVEDNAESPASKLGELAERQENLAEAAKALADGNLAEAEKALAEAGAEPAGAKGLEESAREMLAEEQAAIAHDARAELAEARQDSSPLADALPEAAGAAQDAKEAMDSGSSEDASTAAREAAGAMEDVAKEASQAARSATGETASEESARAANLQELSERQDQVARAAEALAAGQAAEALHELQAMAAERGEGLAQQLAAQPELMGAPMREAADQSRQGGEQAGQAGSQAKAGEMQNAAQSHGESSDSFQRAADSLDRAAAHLAEEAAKAASRENPGHLAPASDQSLAEAFQQAGQAANGQSPSQSAQHASQAAQALAQAAKQGRQQMSGQGPPSPGQPNQPNQGDGPSPRANNEYQLAQADRGVPPELAKLGISASDWEKIQASLRRDAGGGGFADVPEDYRGLVSDYFQSMAEGE